MTLAPESDFSPPPRFAGGVQVGSVGVGESPGDFAAHVASERVFVGYHHLSPECTLGVIDAADPSPAAWTLAASLTEAGCVRYVDVAK